MHLNSDILKSYEPAEENDKVPFNARMLEYLNGLPNKLGSVPSQQDAPCNAESNSEEIFPEDSVTCITPFVRRPIVKDNAKKGILQDKTNVPNKAKQRLTIAPDRKRASGMFRGTKVSKEPTKATSEVFVEIPVVPASKPPETPPIETPPPIEEPNTKIMKDEFCQTTSTIKKTPKYAIRNVWDNLPSDPENDYVPNKTPDSSLLRFTDLRDRHSSGRNVYPLQIQTDNLIDELKEELINYLDSHIHQRDTYEQCEMETEVFISDQEDYEEEEFYTALDFQNVQLASTIGMSENILNIRKGELWRPRKL